MQKNRPSRPPQPNIEQEGILIDLSSPSGESGTSTPPVNLHNSTRNQPFVSILDEPIDVPTSYDLDCHNEPFEIVHDSDNTNLQQIAPPPYHMPPQYSNTMKISRYDFEEINDPFDTSHVLPMSRQTVEPQSTTQSVAGDSAARSSSSSISSRELMASIKRYQSLQDCDNSNTYMNNSQNKGAISKINNNLTGNSTLEYDNSSESLEVNLSNLTLDTVDGTLNMSASSKKLDKSFLAELEKDMYKSEASTSTINHAETYAGRIVAKETSVNQFILNNQPSTSQGIYANTQNRIYEPLPSSATYLSPKKNNTVQSDTSSLVNKMWMEKNELYGNLPN